MSLSVLPRYCASRRRARGRSRRTRTARRAARARARARRRRAACRCRALRDSWSRRPDSAGRRGAARPAPRAPAVPAISRSSRDAPVSDQRIRHFAERLLDRLLIDEHRFLAPRLGERDLRSRASGVEDRLHQRRGGRPRAAGAGEERRQRRAGDAAGSGQRDLRKIRRPRDADLRRWPRRCTCSACWMSGRRSSSADGSPAGSSGGVRLLGERAARAGSGPGCGRAAR